MNLDAATDVEAYVADLQSALITPLDRECLVCYLLRMVGEFGCDGTHRWTLRWRKLSAPRATALLRRLANGGGCCCDCEVLMNVYPERLPRGRLSAATSVCRYLAARFHRAVQARALRFADVTDPL